MKQVEWNVEERRHGKDLQVLYKHGAWRLTVNVNRPNGKVRGHISKRKRHSIVDYLVEGQTLTKGLGIPDYVVNKANELMNPVTAPSEEESLEVGLSNEHVGFSQPSGESIQPGASYRLGKGDAK